MKVINRKGNIVLMALSIFILSILFFFFNPEKNIWFPKCPFYLITGYQCPACGSQRAVYHLLHLQIKEAFGYNPFMVISVPYVVLLILTTWVVPQNRFQKLRVFCYHPITIWTYIILIVIWWVVRNILFPL